MTGYKSSGYNLDKMELTWLWLDAQAERINRKETKNESKETMNESKETKNESKQPHRHPLTD